jgi:hypothetical protein
MNRRQLPGQTWTPIARGVWRCSLCGKPTRDQYGHNPTRKPSPSKERKR